MKSIINKSLLICVILFGEWSFAMAYGPYHGYLGENLYFQVIDESGANLPDVTVSMWFADGSIQQFVSSTGAFACMGGPIGQHAIRLSKTGYKTETFVVEFMEPGSRTVNYPIKIKLKASSTSSSSSLIEFVAKIGSIESLLTRAKLSATLQIQQDNHMGYSLLTSLPMEAILPFNQKLTA